MVASQIRSRFQVQDRNEANQAGADAIFTGVLVRESGKLVLDGLVQSASLQKTQQTFRITSPDSNLLKMADQTAHMLDPKAGPSPLKDPESLRRLGGIYGATGVAELEARCLAFLENEPSFGPAYEICVSRIPAAQARPGLQRILALAEGHENDLGAAAASAIALSHFQAGDMAKARTFYRTLTTQMPEAWNQLIYIEGFLGDFASAQKAFEEYRKASPKTEANAYDSLGEVYFLGKRYSDAERVFLEGVKVDPAFAGGIGWLKAGAARLAQGNYARAEELMVNQLKGLPQNDRRRPALELTWRQLLAAGKAGPAASIELVEKTLIQRRVVQPL